MSERWTIERRSAVFQAFVCVTKAHPPHLQLGQLLKGAAHDLDVLRDGLVGHQLLLHATDEDVDGAWAHKLGCDLLHLLGPCRTAGTLKTKASDEDVDVVWAHKVRGELFHFLGPCYIISMCAHTAAWLLNAAVGDRLLPQK